MAVVQATGVPVASFLCSGLSFRSRLSLGGGTGNGPMISLRPSITDKALVVRFQKRAHKPLLTAARFDETDVAVPWLRGKR